MLFKRTKPVSNDNVPQPAPTSEPASVIGRDAEITGGFSTAGDVHVEGTLRGTLKARRCVVEPDGFVEGQIIAEEIVVRGRIVGPVRAYHVHLESGATVEGDVINDGIVIDNGAELTGSVWRSANPLDESLKPPASSRQRSDGARFLESSRWPEVDAPGSRPLAVVRPR